MPKNRGATHKTGYGALGPSFSLLLPFIGSAAVLVGVAVSFGFAYASAFYGYFGMSATSAGFSTQDYLRLSILTLFYGVGGILVVALLLPQAHPKVARFLQSSERLGLIGGVIAALRMFGTLLFAVGILANFWSWLLPLDPALGIALGFFLLSAAAYLRGNTRLRERSDEPNRSPAWERAAKSFIVIMLVALSLFVLLTAYAVSAGVLVADDRLAWDRVHRSDVVYSSVRLNLDNPGVVEAPLGDPSGYRFKTTGLILLLRSGGKYFLIPSCWTEQRRVVIVLPDDPSIRVEFRSHPDEEEPTCPATP